VRATDAVEGARTSARDRMAAALAPRVAKGAMTEAERDATLARLTVVDRIEDIAPADLVIEAVARTAGREAGGLSALEPLLAKDAVLATNTSSLSVAALPRG
jgi:3-hydroxybutyryl-CoA dehydrogenase